MTSYLLLLWKIRNIILQKIKECYNSNQERVLVLYHSVEINGEPTENCYQIVFDI
jgi:hypothetical protein